MRLRRRVEPEITYEALARGEVLPPPPPLPPDPPPLDPALTPADVVIEAKTGRVRQAGASSAEGEEMLKLKAAAQRDLFVFSKFVLGRKRLTPHFHGALAQRIMRVPPRRKLFLIPMGTFKTTLVSQALPMHMHIQDAETNRYWPGLDGSEMRIMLGCETEGLASSRLRWVASQWESNKLLRAFWPHKCWEHVTQAPKWNETEMILPRAIDYPEPSIHARGVGGAFVGYHYNVLLFDDIIALAAANSVVLMQTASDWVKAAKTRLSPDEDLGLIFVIGTRWAPKDVYEEMLDDPTFECEVRAIVEEGQPLVPELFDLKKIDQLQKDDGIMFWLWRMNSTADPELVDFDMAQVREYQLKQDEFSQETFLLFGEDDRDLALSQTPAPKAIEDPPPRLFTLEAQREFVEGTRADYFAAKGRGEFG